MKVVQVLNNNVVLAVTDAHKEVIVTGWGVGFQRKPGQLVDATKVVRTFVPEADRDPDVLAAQLAELDPAYLTAVADALQAESAHLKVSPGSASVVALADHFQVAQLRHERGGASTAHPLAAEVINLYAKEYAAAQRILASVNQKLGLSLPQDESIAVALHLVNAGFMTGDLTETYRMTGVFNQIFHIIAASFDITVDPHSLSAARFITHLRYFFVRATRNRQINDGASLLRDSLELTHPESLNCATKLASVLELRLGEPVTADEVAYLGLHISRLVSEAAK
jgi:hypothetical protein